MVLKFRLQRIQYVSTLFEKLSVLNKLVARLSLGLVFLCGLVQMVDAKFVEHGDALLELEAARCALLG